MSGDHLAALLEPHLAPLRAEIAELREKLAEKAPPVDRHGTIPEFCRVYGIPTKRGRAAVKLAGLVGRPRGFDPATKFPKFEYRFSAIAAALLGGVEPAANPPIDAAAWLAARTARKG